VTSDPLDRAATELLVCAVCGSVSEDGEGWKAEIGMDENDEGEVVVFCPACWRAEFEERPEG